MRESPYSSETFRGRMGISRVFTDRQALGAAAGTWRLNERARPTVAPRSPVGRRHRGGSADGPSSRIRGHSGGRSWGQHTMWIGVFAFDVGVGDS
jgi:hypothetical protein